MKTEVYSWRLSAETKAELEREARREGTSVAKLLQQITADWLAERNNGHPNDDAGQAEIRRRAMAAIGSVEGCDPARSERSSELIREIIHRKHLKESNALASRFGRRNAHRAD